MYSPEFVTLHYPVNFPLLPAAFYLHLTASKLCLHLVKMNANLDSYFFLSSGLLLLPNMLASFNIMNLGFERWERNRVGVHPYMDKHPYFFSQLVKVCSEFRQARNTELLSKKRVSNAVSCVYWMRIRKITLTARFGIKLSSLAFLL